MGAVGRGRITAGPQEEEGVVSRLREQPQEQARKRREAAR